MNEFKSALNAFLAGQTGFAQVELVLARSLQMDPSIGPIAFAAVDQLYRGGRLPLQLYVALKNKIAQSHAAASRAAHQPPPPKQPPPPQPPPAQQQPLRSAPPPPSSAAPPPSAVPPPRAAPQASVPPPEPAAADHGDRTIMRARPRPQAPDAGPPSAAVPPPDPVPTGGFRQAHTILDPASQTGQTGQTGRTGGFTSRTGSTGTGTGNSSWTDASKWADQPAQSLERGSVLKGRFVLENVVGRGGMGVVFRAKDMRKEEAQDRDPYVAIKILNDEFRRHPESLKALQREARKSQNLAHPNIVSVFDFDRDGATVYMTMEFLEGEALDRVIKSPQFEGMPLDEAYPIIKNLGNALSYAHGKGIVHSDFKPGNCFLTKSGVVKVFDFGIAQAAKIGVEATGEMTKFDAGTLGALTPAYASFEMIEGEQPDQRDDIYALGCVIYELLTGKHPFGKKSAKEAHDGKLVPAPIKGLKTRQWRALQKALAFKRADRSATVDELVDGLGKQAANPTRIAVGIAAVLIVAVVGYFGLLQWQAQKTERLIEALQSADDSRVPAALEDLNAREALEKNTILQQVREPLLGWFEQRVNRAADVSRELYDFPRALAILDEANQWYPDSARIGEVRAQLTADRNDLLATLDGRYTAALDAGRLLSDPAADDVPEVLAILAQVQPDNKLLTDPQLVAARALAYEQRAAAALAAASLGTADQLIELGLAASPEHAGLRNLRDKLTGERAAAENARRVAELVQSLAPVDQARTLADLRALEPAAAELARIDPNHNVLGTYRQRLLPALDAEVNAAVGNRDWGGAQALIDGVAAFLAPEQQTAVRNRVTRARGDYDGRIQGLVANVERAAQEGRLDAARGVLDDLAANGADDATIQRGRNAVLGGYVSTVNGFVAAGNFAAADQTLAAALAFDPQSNRLSELRNTIALQRTAAEQADRTAAEQQRVAQAQTLRTSLQNALAQPNLTLQAAERAVGDADKLALAAADDPLAGRRGHERIAQKLADQALAIGGQDQWDQALKLIDDARGLGLTAGSILDDTRAAIVSDRDADRAREGEQRLAQQQQSLDALIAAPRYDAAWVTEVRSLVTTLRRTLPENDSRLQPVGAAQQRAGELLVARAGEMRASKRFDEAERMLTAARDFAAGLPALETERQALAAALAEAQRATEQAQAQAAVARFKNTFELRVQANNVREALAALDELKRVLPATDAYLTTTAPQQLAGVYARLADAPLKAKELDRAQQLVDEGLKLWANSPDLRKLNTDIRDARAAATAVAPPAGAPATATPAPPVVPVAVPATPPAEASPAPTQASRGQACMPALAGLGNRGARGQCYDMLDASTRGPTLVVVPAGGGVASFAIGRTEVSVAEWSDYCRLSNNCTALTGQEDLPAASLDSAAAEAYAAWLTRTTGVAYRLPTREEWLHAAAAPRGAAINYNCIDARSGRGNRPETVGRDNGNDWGVRDYFGNVRELVKTSDGYELRGGSYRDQLGRCNAERVDAYEGQADAFTGFRLARDLGEQR